MGNIGLVGYYGFNNYGDDIFLEIWRDKLGSHRAMAITPYDNLDTFDKIIIGGGDLIWANAFNNNYFNERWFENGRKVYVYGIGVADIENKVFSDVNVFNLYKNFLSRVNYISTRDKESATWLKEVFNVDAKWVEDIAWNYESKISEPKGKDEVGITYRRNSVYCTEDMVSLSLSLIERGKNLKLIPLQNGYVNTRMLNQGIYDEVARDIGYPSINTIPLYYDTQHKYSYIRSCNYYITCAFHGLITALKERIPVICLDHSTKFKQLLLRVQMYETLINKVDLYDKVKYLLSSDYKFNEKWLGVVENKAKVQLNNFIAEHINEN